MKHQLVDSNNFHSIDFNEYKYAITLEPISLIPVKDHATMIKKVIITARRYDRGALLTNDLAKAADLIRKYGGYVYDMRQIKKVLHNTKGSELENWNIDHRVTSQSTKVFFGITEVGIEVTYFSGLNDHSVMIRNIQQLKGDLS